MNHSNLVELFKTLTTKELKDFSAFLDSPYFAKGKYRKEVVKLFEILAKYTPEGLDKVDLNKDKIYKRVFPGDPPMEGRLERVMMELLKSLRIFLQVDHYLENEHDGTADFIEILMHRQLSQRAANAARTLSDDLIKTPVKSAETYALLFKASKLSYYIESYKNTWKEDLHIGQTLRYLDLYYFATRLELLNHYLLLSKLARVDAGIDLDKEKQIVHFFELTREEAPIIFITQRIFELYTSPEPSPQAFEELLDMLNVHESEFGPEEAKKCFVFLRNYCSTLIQTGGLSELWPVLHRIQRENLEKGYFYYGVQIPPGALLSISNAAMRVNEFEWAFDFIQAHQERIMGDNEHHDYYRFALANYYFYQEQYAQSLEYIPPAAANLDYHLFARRLELMNYYKLDSDLLPYKIDAFKMYLSRGRQKFLSEDYYEQNNNFVNLLFQLMQSRPGDPKRREILLRRIDEKKQVAAKDWLVEQVKLLK